MTAKLNQKAPYSEKAVAPKVLPEANWQEERKQGEAEARSGTSDAVESER